MSPPSEILAVLRLAGWQQSPTSEHIGQTQCLAALHSRSTYSEWRMARARIDISSLAEKAKNMNKSPIQSDTIQLEEGEIFALEVFIAAL